MGLAHAHIPAVKVAKELSFWAKAKLAIKGFFKGAVAMAPRALLIAGASLGASATMHHFTGIDPLGVTTSGNVLLKLLGLAGISTIAAGVGGCFDCATGSDNASAATPHGRNTSQRQPETGAVQNMGYGPPPFTPGRSQNSEMGNFRN